MKILKKYWRRWNMKKARAGDSLSMDRVYLIRDPWGLDSVEQHYRFRETSRIIRTKIGDHLGSILEIGCGEGIQTEYLAVLADRIIGLDPSPQAVRRAAARNVPNADFTVGDVLSYDPGSNGKFDLVVACEVLYYFRDPGEVCECLNRLGRKCLVTYYEGAFERLDKCFPCHEVESEVIRGESSQWKVVYWESN